MRTAEQKAPWVLIAWVVGLLLGSSCSTMKGLRYGVAVVNEGTEKITVAPFDIGEGSQATVAVGEVSPGKTAGVSPFYTKPLQTIALAWHVRNAERRGHADVRTKIPKEFIKSGGGTIILRIHPDERRVEVSYEILDQKTGRVTVIRQEDAAAR